MDHCDFFGQELAIGDRVAYIDGKYQMLRHGEILKLNEKTVTLRDLDFDGPDRYKDDMGWGKTVRGYCYVVREPGGRDQHG